MKKFMILLIAIIPLLLISSVEFATVIIKNAYYVAVEQVVFPQAYQEVVKEDSGEVKLEFAAFVYPQSATDKEVIYSSSNRFIATPYGDNQFLKEISDSELTEEKLLSYIKSSIFEYVSDFDYVQYTYSCETQLKCFSDDATWNENREGFHISTTENESVKYYVVEFVKYASNIATGSHIRIICDESGNIITFGYLIFDVDWGTPNIDDAILSDSIENFLKQNINDEYKYISFEIKSQRLIYEDNEIKLHVEVIVALKHLNEEFSTSCSFKLNLNNTWRKILY